MKLSKTRCVVALMSMGSLLGACGSSSSGPAAGDDGGGTGPGDFIPCMGTGIWVKGTLEGTPIDLMQSSNGAGFSQLNGGSFCSLCVAPDPALVDVHLQWMGLIADGETGAATGSIVMPTNAPRAGEKLCAGAGTKIHMVSGGILEFVILGIKAGAACDQEVSGDIHGCFQ
jgi:hypothetical protein